MPIKGDCVFIVSEDLYDPFLGYELHVIYPKTKGIHKTSFYCGHDFDLALEWVNELNRKNGHTPAFVTSVIEIVSGLADIQFSALQ